VTRLSGSLTWSRAGNNRNRPRSLIGSPSSAREMVEKKLDKGDRRQDRYLGCEVAGRSSRSSLSSAAMRASFFRTRASRFFQFSSGRRASLQPEWLRGRKIGTACWKTGFCTSGPPTAWSR